MVLLCISSNVSSKFYILVFLLPTLNYLFALNALNSELTAELADQQ